MFKCALLAFVLFGAVLGEDIATRDQQRIGQRAQQMGAQLGRISPELLGRPPKPQETSGGNNGPAQEGNEEQMGRGEQMIKDLAEEDGISELFARALIDPAQMKMMGEGSGGKAPPRPDDMVSGATLAHKITAVKADPKTAVNIMVVSSRSETDCENVTTIDEVQVKASAAVTMLTSLDQNKDALKADGTATGPVADNLQSAAAMAEKINKQFITEPTGDGQQRIDQFKVECRNWFMTGGMRQMIDVAAVGRNSDQLGNVLKQQVELLTDRSVARDTIKSFAPESPDELVKQAGATVGGMRNALVLVDSMFDDVLEEADVRTNKLSAEIKKKIRDEFEPKMRELANEMNTLNGSSAPTEELKSKFTAAFESMKTPWKEIVNVAGQTPSTNSAQKHVNEYDLDDIKNIDYAQCKEILSPFRDAALVPALTSFDNQHDMLKKIVALQVCAEGAIQRKSYFDGFGVLPAAQRAALDNAQIIKERAEKMRADVEKKYEFNWRTESEGARSEWTRDFVDYKLADYIPHLISVIEDHSHQIPLDKLQDALKELDVTDMGSFEVAREFIRNYGDQRENFIQPGNVDEIEKVMRASASFVRGLNNNKQYLLDNSELDETQKTAVTAAPDCLDEIQGVRSKIQQAIDSAAQDEDVMIDSMAKPVLDYLQPNSYKCSECGVEFTKTAGEIYDECINKMRPMASIDFKMPGEGPQRFLATKDVNELSQLPVAKEFVAEYLKPDGDKPTDLIRTDNIFDLGKRAVALETILQGLMVRKDDLPAESVNVQQQTLLTSDVPGWLTEIRGLRQKAMPPPPTDGSAPVAPNFEEIKAEFETKVSAMESAGLFKTMPLLDLPTKVNEGSVKVREAQPEELRTFEGSRTLMQGIGTDPQHLTAHDSQDDLFKKMMAVRQMYRGVTDRKDKYVALPDTTEVQKQALNRVDEFSQRADQLTDKAMMAGRIDDGLLGEWTQFVQDITKDNNAHEQIVAVAQKNTAMDTLSQALRQDRFKPEALAADPALAAEFLKEIESSENIEKLSDQPEVIQRVAKAVESVSKSEGHDVPPTMAGMADMAPVIYTMAGGGVSANTQQRRQPNALRHMLQTVNQAPRQIPGDNNKLPPQDNQNKQQPQADQAQPKNDKAPTPTADTKTDNEAVNNKAPVENKQAKAAGGDAKKGAMGSQLNSVGYVRSMGLVVAVVTIVRMF